MRTRRFHATIVVLLTVSFCLFSDGTVWVIDENGSCADATIPSVSLDAPTKPTNLPGPLIAPCPYPDATNTGVPWRTILTTINGDIDLTAGQVLSNKHVIGNVHIRGDGAVIKNSLIDGVVENTSTGGVYSFTITDSTVGSPKCDNVFSDYAIGRSKYTATRVKVQGHTDGMRVDGGDILIQDSLILLCGPDTDATVHSDGIQSVRGGVNVRIIHNTVHQLPCSLAVFFPKGRACTADISQAAPIFIGPETSPLAVDIENNLFIGGGYSIRVYSGNGPGPFIVRNNAVVNGSWRFGPVHSSCATIDWSGNTLVTVNRFFQPTSTLGSLACAGP